MNSAGSAIFGLAVITAGVALYILPIVIASYRRADSLSPVTVVCLFLGWTGIGWIVALAMAVSGPSRRPPKTPVPPYYPQSPWR